MKPFYLSLPMLFVVPASAVGTLRATPKAKGPPPAPQSVESVDLDLPAAESSALAVSAATLPATAGGSVIATDKGTADKFAKWLDASLSADAAEAHKAETDSKAFLGVRSALAKSKHDVGVLQRKLLHAVKWGQDLSKLFQSSAERERKLLHDLSESEVKKEDEIRKNAQREEGVLQLTIANQTAELQAQAATIQELKKELEQNRHSLDKATEASSSTEKQLESKVKTQAAELNSREQLIQRLQSLSELQDRQLNATRRQSQEIVRVARGKIAEVRASEKSARDELEKVQERARTRESQLRERLEREDMELADETRHEKELQQQVVDLEAVVRGDTVVAGARGDQVPNMPPAPPSMPPPTTPPVAPTPTSGLKGDSEVTTEEQDALNEVDIDTALNEGWASEAKQTGTPAKAAPGTAPAAAAKAEGSKKPAVALAAIGVSAEHNAFEVPGGFLAMPTDLASPLED